MPSRWPPGTDPTNPSRNPPHSVAVALIRFPAHVTRSVTICSDQELGGSSADIPAWAPTVRYCRRFLDQIQAAKSAVREPCFRGSRHRSAFVHQSEYAGIVLTCFCPEEEEILYCHIQIASLQTVGRCVRTGAFRTTRVNSGDVITHRRSSGCGHAFRLCCREVTWNFASRASSARSSNISPICVTHSSNHKFCRSRHGAIPATHWAKSAMPSPNPWRTDSGALIVIDMLP